MPVSFHSHVMFALVALISNGICTSSITTASTITTMTPTATTTSHPADTTVEHSPKDRLSSYIHSGPLNSILIGPLGHVFVGGQNTIIQFSPEGTGSNKEFEIDTRCMQITCQNHAKGTNDVSILMRLDFYGEEYLLFCGTNPLSCFLLNSTDITEQLPVLPYREEDKMAGTISSKESAFAICTSRHNIFSAINTDHMRSNGNETIFTFSERFLFKKRSGEIILNYKHALTETNYILAKPHVEQSFEFKYGFDVGDYIYFLRNSNHYTAYISQICKSSQHFRAYIESSISCDGASVLSSAHVVHTDKYGDVLVTTFTDKTRSFSRFCTFKVKDIETHFKTAKNKCFKGGIGHSPSWIDATQTSCTKVPQRDQFLCGESASNPHISSIDEIRGYLVTPLYTNGSDIIPEMTSITMDVKNGNVGYVGYADGRLKKIRLNGDLSAMVELYGLDTGARGPITNMELNNVTNKLIFTAGSMVGTLDTTDDCQFHTICRDCLVDDGLCEPNIVKMTPVSGPISGNTKVTLIGRYFGILPNDSLSVIVGLAPCTIISSNFTSIVCKTPKVNGTTELEADVSVTITHTISSHLKLENTTTFTQKFHYKTPSLKSDIDSITVMRQGGVEITIRGRGLHIGGYRQVVIGNKTCPITSFEDEFIKCKAPEQSPTGRYRITVLIDSSIIQGQYVTYINDPVLTSIIPNKIIRSGGIRLTVKGDNFQGIGDDVHIRYIGDLGYTGLCDVVSSTILVCKSMAVNALDGSTVKVTFNTTHSTIQMNATNSSAYTLQVVADPMLQDIGHVIFVKEEQNINILGDKLSNVDQNEVNIRVGKNVCNITFYNDTALKCRLDVIAFLRQDVNRTIKATIGNIPFILGNALVQPQAQVVITTSSIGESRAADDTSTVTTVSVILGVIVFVIVAAVVAIFMQRMSKKSSREDQYHVAYRRGSDILTLDGLSENNATDVSQNRQNTYQEQTFMKTAAEDSSASKDTEPLLQAVDDDTRRLLERQHLLIDKNDLVLGEVVGRGHFGCVHKGYLRIAGQKEEKIVAAKTLHRANPNDMDVQTFLKEALIMKDFHHHNVMELMGICLGMQKLPLVVLPYLRRGDMLTYLRDSENVPTVKELVMFGIDIANGMHYLSELKFVHRDLAARNCMIDEDLSVKVADFGLSRDVYEKEYYSSCDKTTKLPVKWMSPESLELCLYSSKSDMWSYGIVLWELLTRGIVPYPTVDNWEILRYLKEHRRLDQPTHCPDEMYAIMQRCWSWEPEDRPSFGELTIEIPKLIHKLQRDSQDKNKQLHTEIVYVNFAAQNNK